mgnify:CR=1 FL=1
MLVKDLITELQKVNPDYPVMINGYEGGVSEGFTLRIISVNRNKNTAWYYGEHDEDILAEEPGHDLSLLLEGK